LSGVTCVRGTIASDVLIKASFEKSHNLSLLFYFYYYYYYYYYYYCLVVTLSLIGVGKQHFPLALSRFSAALHFISVHAFTHYTTPHLRNASPAAAAAAAVR
jgi:hypothetical protein